MAISPASLFGGDQPVDFTGITPVEIFSRTALARAQSFADVLQDQPEPPANPQVAAQPTGSSPADLFAVGEPEVIPPPSVNRQTEAQSLEAPPQAIPVEENYNAPMAAAPANPAAPSGKYQDFADFMFQSEARMSDGKLQVYTPPSGDGGGSYEVAGITQKYQPQEAARLKALIDSGRNDEAAAAAKDFYRQRAAPFTSLTQDRGLQLQLADTVHHRGEGGLRRVLQRATGSDSRDYGELIGGLSERKDALDAFHQARQDYEWEEVDRGRASRKKFRNGLQNRFNNADAAARSF